MQPTLFPLTHSEREEPRKTVAGEDALNPAQLQAVTTVDGPILVIAGAGSGKTRTLVYRLAYLVERGISPENILLLTFTRKAAQEMVSRASMLMSDDCRRVMGGTFHSIANLLLRRYGHHVGFAPNFTILDRSDSEGIINLIKSSLELGSAESKRFPSKRIVLNIISGAVNKSRQLDDLIFDHHSHLIDFVEDIKRIQKHYIMFKKDHGLMDYDDLLVFFRDVLVSVPEVREEVSKRFQYIMVDEYQDTNRIQAEIVRQIAGSHNNVMAVGDDSQSIYSFRGADFRNIMDFPKLFPKTKMIRLEENYRSTQSILETTNAIIARASERYTKTLFSNIEGGEKPFLFGGKDESDQARFVAEKIASLHSQGKPLNDMAVLFRSGFHSYKLELELTNRHIRFEKRGGLKMTETAHVKDVLSFFRIICNEGDYLSWNRILLQLPKVGPKTAQKILETVKKVDEPLVALKTYKAGKTWRQAFVDMLETITEILKIESPVAQFDRIFEYYQPIFERLYADDFPRRQKDLEQLKSIIGEYDSLQSFLDDTALDPPDTGAGDLQQEDDTLVLSTVHSAKGLEWDTVFVIHLADGKFPSSHAAADPEQLEEERRLLYVAATRAKRQLFLSYPRESLAPDRSRQFCSLTPFLAELPSGLVTIRKPGAFQSSVRDSFAPDTYITRKKVYQNNSTAGKSENSSFHEGVAVRHGFFGEGKITHMKDTRTAEVFFPRHGLKTLRLDYAKLELVT